MTTFKPIRSDYINYKSYSANFFMILFCFIFKSISFLWQKLIGLTTGISITASVKTWHCFYIQHFAGIILNKDTFIGDNCKVAQNFMIGVSSLGENRGVLAIGDNVYIAENSFIAGKIVISQNGSKGYI